MLTEKEIDAIWNAPDLMINMWEPELGEDGGIDAGWKVQGRR